MAEISEKHSEPEDLHELPFDADTFQQTFNGYVRKFHTIFIIFFLPFLLSFVAYAIAIYLEMTKVDVTGFWDFWHAAEALLLNLGLPDLSYKVFSSGIVSFGGVSVGIISVGAYFSCGVISIGGFGSCGVVSIGCLSSVGIVSIGSRSAYGLIAIALGSKKPFEPEYILGKAIGVFAIGRQARGTYALSYGNEGSGSYQFSPERQDPEAVALFTRWFRKFKGAFAAPS